MSWSVNLIGRPEKIAIALKEQSDKISGQAKIEYDDALPHLIGLVNQTFSDPSSVYPSPIVKLVATGSGAAKDNVQIQRSCTVSIEPFYSTLV